MVEHIASGNIQAQQASIGVADLAQGYLGVAKRLLPAIDVLAKSTDKVTSGLAMLTAHSLECALKTYLVHKDMPEKQLLGHNKRHNLEWLWQEAVTLKLSIEDQPPHWCTTLNSLHNKPYHLRYPTGVNALVFPAANSMILGLKSVIAAVTKELN